MTDTVMGAGRRRGRPPKAEAGDTKGALLGAALTLFAEKGYEGTSVRAIAREVGLSESVLYAHFDSKRAIFDAVLAELGPASVVALVEGLDQAQAASDPAAFIRSMVSRAMDEWSAPQPRQLISLMAQDGLLHDPALAEGIRGALGRLAELFGLWIAGGQIPVGLGSPLDLAYALISPITMARVLWLHGGAKPEELATARERATRHAEFFIEAVFRA